MKKLIVLLMVLALAVPSMAAVTLTGTASSGTTAVIGATWGAGERPRAFALTLTTNAGTITGVAAAKTGVSTSASRGFGIFPGSIQIDAGGVVTNYGTPVEPNSLPGGGALNTYRVIVALGSLYSPTGDANAPTSGGALFTVTVAGAGSLTVTPETQYRGGVVDENSVSVAVSPITVTFATDCLQNKSAAIFADWVAYGKPASWCAPYQCDGDADGVTSGAPFNYRIYSGDLNLVVANWKKTLAGFPGNGLNPAADVDHKSSGAPFNYRVYSGDLNLVVANWKKLTGAFAGDCATRVQN